MSDQVKMFIAAMGYLSLVYVMVRPGSQGPQIVTQLADGFANILKAATGGATW